MDFSSHSIFFFSISNNQKICTKRACFLELVSSWIFLFPVVIQLFLPKHILLRIATKCTWNWAKTAPISKDSLKKKKRETTSRREHHRFSIGIARRVNGMHKAVYKFLMTSSVKIEVVALPFKSLVLCSGPEAMVFKTAVSILSA